MKLNKTLFVFTTAVVAWTVGFTQPLHAEPTAPLVISQKPLFESANFPPMNMLVMGRDHTLFYQAYNDASDLTGNGQIDVGYKPDEIDYYGYFDSFKCYSYSGGIFSPSAATANKKCGSGWSGDFLNWVTTSRMDALRKVLYGGSRYIDDEDRTVLQRAYIPQDAHSWGKEYQSIARDGYDISEYTPLSLPGAGRYHLFANTTLRTDNNARPRMRVLRNTGFRVWEWVAIERPVAGDFCLDGRSGPGERCTDDADGRDDYNVRVEVCSESIRLEQNCQQYPNGEYKPIGLLQEFGETGRMDFGLISGSYTNNSRGGVLRSPMGNISDEIDEETGQFDSDDEGIIATIDRFMIMQFGNNNAYEGGWMTTAPLTNNPTRFRDWGNPIAEMVYESLRYFMGKGAPTNQFVAGISGDSESVNSRGPISGSIEFPVAEWDDPYDSRPYCTAAAQLIISDINPSYDSEFVPGSAFSNFSGDVDGLNVSSEGQAIWSAEYGGSRPVFIGQSGTLSDNNPTPKMATSLGNIRGLSPQEPTKQGSFYTASVARFGVTNDIRPDLVESEQTLETFSVALASSLPEIKMPLDSGFVTLVPFAKSTNGSGINGSQGSFQPTNTIVNFFVEQWTNFGPGNMDAGVNGGRPQASFRINFEDVEQGADHDMDAIVRYLVRVDESGLLEIDVRSEYAAGGIEHAMGYVISGTTQDGVYLEVRDCDTGNPGGNDISLHPSVSSGQCSGNNPSYGGANQNGYRYFLNTPNWRAARPDGAPGEILDPVAPGECALTGAARPEQCDWGLPLSSTRVFTPSGDAAGILRDPLWYAAKYGFSDNEGMAPGETPENYFLVTNAATLADQLTDAFTRILELGATTGLVASSTRLTTGTLAYQAEFESSDWSGDLVAVDPQTQDEVERASEQLASVDPGARKILTFDRDAGTGVEFDSATLSEEVRDRLLASAPEEFDSVVNNLVDYLRGDDSFEQSNGGPFRDRTSRLGDIIGSQPVLSGSLSLSWSGVNADYLEYMDEVKTQRDPILLVGANDGMLHAFDAKPGAGLLQEKFAYVPASVHQNLYRLADPDYAADHRFFVNGTAVIGDARIGGGTGAQAWETVAIGTLGAGGRGIFALDITDPDSPEVKWEFSSEDDPDMGYSFSKPAITRLETGEWVAIVGNGYNSTNNTAHLYVLDLEDGDVIHKIQLGEANFNGLSSVAAIRDPVSQQHVVRVYAGDVRGNMWRVDFSGGSADVAFGGQPLFTDPDGRAITTAPDAALHPVDGWLVYFGTGKLIESDDRINLDMVDRFYGIHDRDSAVGNTLDGLNKSEIQTTAEGREIVSTGPGANGWYMPLVVEGEDPKGERTLSEPQLIFGRVIFTTYQPNDDPCASGGNNFVYQVRALTGGGTAFPIVDGAPLAPPLVIRDPVLDPSGSDPGLPGTDPDQEFCAPGDPGCEGGDPSIPPGAAAGSAEGWCREYGLLVPPNSTFVRLGNLCEGRSVWRQVQ